MEDGDDQGIYKMLTHLKETIHNQDYYLDPNRQEYMCILEVNIEKDLSVVPLPCSYCKKHSFFMLIILKFT